MDFSRASGDGLTALGSQSTQQKPRGRAGWGQQASPAYLARGASGMPWGPSPGHRNRSPEQECKTPHTPLEGAICFTAISRILSLPSFQVFEDGRLLCSLQTQIPTPVGPFLPQAPSKTPMSQIGKAQRNFFIKEPGSTLQSLFWEGFNSSELPVPPTLTGVRVMKWKRHVHNVGGIHSHL